MVKFEPATPNMSQHVATEWPNVRNMLRPAMSLYVALQCCDRLAGALSTHLTVRLTSLLQYITRCWMVKQADQRHPILQSDIAI